MSDRHLVLTPEKVVLEYEIVGIGRRLGAHILDLFVIYALMYIVFIAYSFVAFVLPEASLFIIIILIATYFAYFSVVPIFLGGRTIGKLAVAIRVISYDGTPASGAQLLYRSLLLVGDYFMMVGVVMMALTPRSQRFGDFVANTLVVTVPRRRGRFTVAPHKYGTHPLEHTIGDLAGMQLEEYVAIKRLCDRFPELSRPIQARSIEEIWLPFAKRYGIQALDNVHPVYQMEAVIMKFGRQKRLV